MQPQIEQDVSIDMMWEADWQAHWQVDWDTEAKGEIGYTAPESLHSHLLVKKTAIDTRGKVDDGDNMLKENVPLTIAEDGSYSIPSDKINLAGLESGATYTLTIVSNMKDENTADVSFSFDAMQLTLNIATANTTFAVPVATGATPATLAFVWDDNSQSEEITSVSTENRAHSYTTMGEKTFKILTMQTDRTQKQIPEFNFGKYPTNAINNYARNTNAELLYSIDTPVLYTGTAILTAMFYGIDNLASISEETFYLHPDATKMNDIVEAYNANTALKSLPQKLLSKNTKVTTLKNAFYGLKGITEIPTGFLDNNTEITNFLETFSQCTNLKTIPNGLFANNLKAYNFARTFSGCINIVLNANMFISSTYTKETRFGSACQSTIPINFSNTFATSSKDTYASGVIPELWNYNYAGGPGFTWQTNVVLMGDSKYYTNANITNWSAYTDNKWNAAATSGMTNFNYYKTYDSTYY